MGRNPRENQIEQWNHYRSYRKHRTARPAFAGGKRYHEHLVDRLVEIINMLRAVSGVK
jgi:hypothetical protein